MPMIKFFRKIKQKLISENKFSKYLIYAIGEIILVVVGILIALKVNNWNQNTQNLDLANDYVVNISNDLKNDTIVFGRAIKRLSQLVEVKKWGLKNDLNNNVAVEYFEAIINSQYFNIKINNNTFNQMSNNDVLKLKDFKSLFKKFNTYYATKKDYVDNFNEWELKSANEESKFWNAQNNFEINLMHSDSIPIFQSSKKRKNSIIQILNSNRGRNMMKMSLLRVKTIHDMYSDQKDRAILLLKEIDSLKN